MDTSSFSENIVSDSISQIISFTHFSFITFATLGYGDIIPASNLSKCIVISEVIYRFTIVILVLSVFSNFREHFKKDLNFKINSIDNESLQKKCRD